MNLLPIDLLEKVINNVLLITDVKKLTQTCVLFNKLCKPYINKLEVKYKNNNNIYIFSKHLDKYCIEKFTIEIILDGYYKLLDKKFYRKKNKIICSMLAFCGQQELLRHAISKKCIYNDYTLLCSMYTNTDTIFIYLVKKKLFGKLSSNCDLIVTNIGMSGNIGILKWMYKNKFGHLCNNKKLYESAAYADKLDIILWAYDNIDDLENIYDSKFVNIATKQGHLNIIIWAHSKSYIKDNSFYYKALKYGHLYIIDWAFKNNYGGTDFEKMMKVANTKSLTWLMQHNKIIIDNKFHILIDNQIRKTKYNDVSCNKQKIICCNNDGEIIIHDLNCNNGYCKILLFIMSRNKLNIEAKKWMVSVISKCNEHNWCVQYLNVINFL